MAKNKRRKKRPQLPKSVTMKPENYIRKKGRLLPIYACYVNIDWKESGMAVVVVSRQRSGGKLVFSSYIVDTYCLGVKDTLFKFNVEEYDFEDFLENMYQSMGLQWEKIEAALAFNIIYGAVEYAEDLGFAPHNDFKVTEYLLDEVTTIPFIDIEFGKNGKPFYIAGPHDNLDKIYTILEKNAGEGNFDFLMDPEMLSDRNPWEEDMEYISEEEDLEEEYTDYEEIEETDKKEK